MKKATPFEVALIIKNESDLLLHQFFVQYLTV